MQAAPALVAQVYFDGEYRIANGQWQKICRRSGAAASFVWRERAVGKIPVTKSISALSLMKNVKFCKKTCKPLGL